MRSRICSKIIWGEVGLAADGGGWAHEGSYNILSTCADFYSCPFKKRLKVNKTSQNKQTQRKKHSVNVFIT